MKITMKFEVKMQREMNIKLSMTIKIRIPFAYQTYFDFHNS